MINIRSQKKPPTQTSQPSKAHINKFYKFRLVFCYSAAQALIYKIQLSFHLGTIYDLNAEFHLSSERIAKLWP